MERGYRDNSLRLYQCLDWIGASEELRGIHREHGVVGEILFTVTPNCLKSDAECYVFGSSHEGTTTRGLDSDVDILYCVNTPVVERVYNVPQRGRAYLMVNDDSTKPGYLKLQVVDDGVPQTIYQRETDSKLEETDHWGRICKRHFTHCLKGDVSICNEINGPALTSCNKHGSVDSDCVLAYRCQYVPNFATSWIARERHCNQPHPKLLETMATHGCFLVGVNHPHSQNDKIEFRLSFSLQERALMNSLNPTQHKCYILMKMIKKDIISKKVPKSISSYHCKTSLFYAIENTPLSFWTQGNLLECTLFCIKSLLEWVKAQNCPNYFIPEENMFDRLENRTLGRVRSVLEDMVNTWYTFLRSITCDGLWDLLDGVLFGSGLEGLSKGNELVSQTIGLKHLNLCTTRQVLLSAHFTECVHRSSMETWVYLFRITNGLTATNCVTEHTEKETRHALDNLMPVLHLNMAQCLASIRLNTRGIDLLRIVSEWFNACIDNSRSCDVISAQLVVASYSIQANNPDICENILFECETALKSHVITWCACYPHPLSVDQEYIVQTHHLMRTNHPTCKEFLKKTTTQCLHFLPCQANLVPPALRWEMFRSVGTLPGSRDEATDKWFDWIVVDSKVYLYFLQYIFYTKTNKPVNKQDAVDNLVHVISTDDNLGHRETAFNLLGWIYKQENRVYIAMECFLKSWSIRPIHNAAKWHGLDLIRSVNRM